MQGQRFVGQGEAVGLGGAGEVDGQPGCACHGGGRGPGQGEQAAAFGGQHVEKAHGQRGVGALQGGDFAAGKLCGTERDGHIGHVVGGAVRLGGTCQGQGGGGVAGFGQAGHEA